MDDETYEKWSLRAVFGAAAVALVGLAAVPVAAFLAPALLPVAGAAVVVGSVAEGGTILHGIYRATWDDRNDATERWSLRFLFGAAATAMAGIGAVGIGAIAAPAIVPAAATVAVAGGFVEAGAILHRLYRSLS